MKYTPSLVRSQVFARLYHYSKEGYHLLPHGPQSLTPGNIDWKTLLRKLLAQGFWDERWTQVTQAFAEVEVEYMALSRTFAVAAGRRVIQVNTVEAGRSGGEGGRE